MSAHTTRKYRLPSTLAVEPARRQSDCLDPALAERRERIAAVRAARRQQHRN